MSSSAAWPTVPLRGKRLSVSLSSGSMAMTPSARASMFSPNISSKIADSSPSRRRSSAHSSSARSVRYSTGSSSRNERIQAREDSPRSGRSRNLIHGLGSCQHRQRQERHAVGTDPQHGVGGAVGGVALDPIVHLDRHAVADHPPQRRHQGTPIGRLVGDRDVGVGCGRADFTEEVAQADHAGSGCDRCQGQGEQRVLAHRERPALAARRAERAAALRRRST